MSDVGAVQQNDAGGVGLFRTDSGYDVDTEIFSGGKIHGLF